MSQATSINQKRKKEPRSQPDPFPPTTLTFDEKVQGDYYQKLVTADYKENRELWRNQENAATATFMADGIKYAIEQGVPEQYAIKVMRRAWEDGHANGYSEILNVLWDLIEIFKKD